MKKVITFFSVLALTGCVSLQPAQEHNVDKRIVVNENYETVWADTIDWFAATGLGIERLQKESGLIVSSPGTIGMGPYLDCGRLDSGRYENFTSTLNVVVRELGPQETQLTINVMGNAVAVSRNGYGHVMDQKPAPCYSTGRLEESIQDYISAN